MVNTDVFTSMNALLQKPGLCVILGETRVRAPCRFASGIRGHVTAGHVRKETSGASESSVVEDRLALDCS